MKKLYIFLFFAVALAGEAEGQKWALPSSEWKIGNTWAGADVSYTTYKVKNDTIIDGVNCLSIGNMYYSLYSYESGDTVYFYQGGQFRSTYYWKAVAGDTISFYDDNYCEGNSTIKVKLHIVDSINVGNKYLQRFSGNIIDRDSTDFRQGLGFSYIEFIGSNHITPYLYCGETIDQDAYWICDYGDSTIQDFYVYKNLCATSDISSIALGTIRIFPNPVKESLYFDFGETTLHGNVSLEITDLLGKEIVSRKEINVEKRVDFRSVPQGMYVCTIYINERALHREKVLVIR